ASTTTATVSPSTSPSATSSSTRSTAAPRSCTPARSTSSSRRATSSRSSRSDLAPLVGAIEGPAALGRRGLRHSRDGSAASGVAAQRSEVALHALDDRRHVLLGQRRGLEVAVRGELGLGCLLR